MIRVKLELDRLTDNEFIDLEELIAAAMAGKAIFSTPNPSLATLIANAYEMRQLIAQRDALLAQAQLKTIAIRDKRNLGETYVSTQGGYVQGIANATTHPEISPEQVAAEAAMPVASAATPVGILPMVEDLKATQGDANGEVDLQWKPIKRGLRTYVVEVTDDPAALTGWRNVGMPGKSKHAVTGLTSGVRYWFRVAGVGSAGQGAWSDPATKVAP
jgi:hypothetical protein